MVSLQSSTLRVLIVDDHELTRLSLKLALQSQANIELVGLASNGLEAVKVARASQPDVVILDLEMPVMDGAVASQRLKQIDPQVKIIGYSSLQDSHLERLIEAAQLDAFCDKSTGTRELVNLAWQLKTQ